MLEAMLLTKKETAGDSVNLLSLLTDTTGLTTNAGGEVYAPSNQQTAGGDGKLYYFAADPQGRLVKRISANFRYTASTSTLTAYYLYLSGGAFPQQYLGLYDDWNAQTGFKLVSDDHAAALTTVSFNGRLTRTFDTPFPQDQLAIRIGGRSGLAYSPAYMKDLVIEYE